MFLLTDPQKQHIYAERRREAQKKRWELKNLCGTRGVLMYGLKTTNGLCEPMRKKIHYAECEEYAQNHFSGH